MKEDFAITVLCSLLPFLSSFGLCNQQCAVVEETQLGTLKYPGTLYWWSSPLFPFPVVLFSPDHHNTNYTDLNRSLRPYFNMEGRIGQQKEEWANSSILKLSSCKLNRERLASSGRGPGAERSRASLSHPGGLSLSQLRSALQEQTSHGECPGVVQAKLLPETPLLCLELLFWEIGGVMSHSPPIAEGMVLHITRYCFG